MGKSSPPITMAATHEATPQELTTQTDGMSSTKQTHLFLPAPQPRAQSAVLVVTPQQIYPVHVQTQDTRAHPTPQTTNETSEKNATWKQRFHELKMFKYQNWHCDVPQKFEENPSLGAWVARQRVQIRVWEEKHEGRTERGHTFSRKELLIWERVERLKDVGLEPSIGKGSFGKRNGLLLTSQNSKDWKNQFANLLRYRDIHGNCDVPTQSDAEFKSLGRWVSSQRKKYREFIQHQQGGSKDLYERFKRLDEVGFKFSIGSGRSQRKMKSAAPFTY